MAMYENRGFCPNNAFMHYGLENKVSEQWDSVRHILGDRLGYMVYTTSGFTYKGVCYIVDALEGATGSLGINIANFLKECIPVCEYAKTGRPIVCTDIINPYQIPAIIDTENGKFVLYAAKKFTRLFEDERYLVAVQDTIDEVHIYLYKK